MELLWGACNSCPENSRLLLDIEEGRCCRVERQCCWVWRLGILGVVERPEAKPRQIGLQRGDQQTRHPRMIRIRQAQGVKPEWTALVGRPAPWAIWLNVNVLEVQGRYIDYNLHGTVDVPSATQNDDERALLAEILFQGAEIPDKGARAHRLASWVETEGGTGIRIDHCEPIPKISEIDILHIQAFEPLEFEEASGVVPQGDNQPPVPL